MITYNPGLSFQVDVYITHHDHKHHHSFSKKGLTFVGVQNLRWKMNQVLKFAEDDHTGFILEIQNESSGQSTEILLPCQATLDRIWDKYDGKPEL